MKDMLTCEVMFEGMAQSYEDFMKGSTIGYELSKALYIEENLTFLAELSSREPAIFAFGIALDLKGPCRSFYL